MQNSRKQYTVRECTVLDLLALSDLAMKYSYEAQKHDNFPVDFEYMVSTAAKATLSDNSVILACFRGNDIIGMLWGYIGRLPWSKNTLAFDAILYVTPEYRGTKAGYLLMKGWEGWAKDKGAVAVQISVASGIHEEQTGEFYEKLGFSPIGRQYRKEL